MSGSQRSILAIWLYNPASDSEVSVSRSVDQRRAQKGTDGRNSHTDRQAGGQVGGEGEKQGHWREGGRGAVQKGGRAGTTPHGLQARRGESGRASAHISQSSHDGALQTRVLPRQVT